MKVFWEDSDYGRNRAKLARVMARNERLAAARQIGTHTKEEWSALHDLFGKCVVCSLPYRELAGNGATKDHIIPISLGGCDCLGNLQPVCRTCNSRGIGFDAREQALPGWQTIYLHKMGAFY